MSDDIKEARQNLAWSSREGCDGECVQDCHICDLLNEFELAVRVDEWAKMHKPRIVTIAGVRAVPSADPARLPGDAQGGR